MARNSENRRYRAFVALKGKESVVEGKIHYKHGKNEFVQEDNETNLEMRDRILVTLKVKF